MFATYSSFENIEFNSVWKYHHTAPLFRFRLVSTFLEVKSIAQLILEVNQKYETRNIESYVARYFRVTRIHYYTQNHGNSVKKPACNI